MWVMPSKGVCNFTVQKAIADFLNGSRFTASVEFASHRYKWGLKVSAVRLRNKKPYCGAHPGPCVLTFERKHRVCRYLEGLDWVGFNHGMNDYLDAKSLSCDFFSYNRESTNSGKYFIRIGRKRRISYPYYQDRFAHWTQSEQDKIWCFDDCCGKPSPDISLIAHSLQGTPGYPCYLLEDEAKFRDAEVVHA